MSAHTLRPPLPLAAYPYTDVGNGERMSALHGNDLRWVPRWKTWLVWDGRRWARDDLGEVERRAKAVVRAMFVEADQLTGDDRKALAAHAMRTEAVGRLDAMVRLVRSEPGIAIPHEALDQQPMLLTVRNGTIDLATGRLQPHSRGDLSAKLVNIDYDPTATCPTWLRVLDTLFAGDASIIEYLQRAVGYSLTGDTREQVLHLCHGTGANGKSTMLDTLGQLGGDYAQQADFSTFLERRGEGPRGDVARLAGARLVRSSEVGENKRLDEGLIKSLTGGDVMTARYLYSEEFEFKPQFKLWLAANHRPVIRGTDYAIWRRVRLLPFEVTISAAQRDDELPAKLTAELPGILRWAVDGCLLWLEQGLAPPARVLAATAQYRQDSDVIGAFLEDCCVEDRTAEAPAGDIYRAYERWARDNGEYVASAQMFGRRLEERGFQVRKTRDGKTRRGLRLLIGDRLVTDVWPMSTRTDDPNSL
jgi:putative DNA primase/helicase